MTAMLPAACFYLYLTGGTQENFRETLISPRHPGHPENDSPQEGGPSSCLGVLAVAPETICPARPLCFGTASHIMPLTHKRCWEET